MAQAQSYAVEPTPGQKMKSFFLACGIGTAAGASLGAASLAFISSPGDNLQNIAKGASLGLYAGILWGYYNVVIAKDPQPINSEAESHWMITPDFNGHQIDGAQVGYIFRAP